MVAGARRTHVSPTGPQGVRPLPWLRGCYGSSCCVCVTRTLHAASLDAGAPLPLPAVASMNRRPGRPVGSSVCIRFYVCVEGDGDRLAAAPGSGAYGVGGLSSRVSSCMKRHLLSFSPLSRGGPAPVRPSRVAVS